MNSLWFCKLSYNVLNHRWLFNDFYIICCLNLWTCYWINSVVSFAWSLNSLCLWSLWDWSSVSNNMNFSIFIADWCNESCSTLCCINLYFVNNSKGCFRFINFSDLWNSKCCYFKLFNTLFNYQSYIIACIVLFCNCYSWSWSWFSWLRLNSLHINNFNYLSILVVNNINLIIFITLFNNDTVSVTSWSLSRFNGCNFLLWNFNILGKLINHFLIIFVNFCQLTNIISENNFFTISCGFLLQNSWLYIANFRRLLNQCELSGLLCIDYYNSIVCSTDLVYKSESDNSRKLFKSNWTWLNIFKSIALLANKFNCLFQDLIVWRNFTKSAFCYGNLVWWWLSGSLANLSCINNCNFLCFLIDNWNNFSSSLLRLENYSVFLSCVILFSNLWYYFGILKFRWLLCNSFSNVNNSFIRFNYISISCSCGFNSCYLINTNSSLWRLFRSTGLLRSFRGRCNKWFSIYDYRLFCFFVDSDFNNLRPLWSFNCGLIEFNSCSWLSFLDFSYFLLFNNFCDLFNKWFNFFGSPLGFWNLFNWGRLRNWLYIFSNRNFLRSHVCYLLCLFVIVVSCLLRLSFFWLLSYNCEDFTKIGILRDNCFYCLFWSLFNNLMKYLFENWFSFLHDCWTSCGDSFRSISCSYSLNCSWSNLFWKWLFISGYDLLIIVTNNSYFSIIISNLWNGFSSNFLHYNSSWLNIFNFWYFSHNSFDNILKMCTPLNNWLICNFSNNNFTNNLFNSVLNCFLCNLDYLLTHYFRLGWLFFISNCNNNCLLIWLCWFLNNECSLNLILRSLSCWTNNFAILGNSIIISYFLNDTLNNWNLLDYFFIICFNNLRSSYWINFNLSGCLFGSN